MPSVDDLAAGVNDDDDDDCLIFPLTDIDRGRGDASDSYCEESRSEVVDGGRRRDVGDGDTVGGVGRSRRRCKSFGSPSERSLSHRSLPFPTHSFSASHHLSLKLTAGTAHMLSPTPGGPGSSPRCNWMHAMRKIRHLKDPWERYHITDRPTETAMRHRYHPLKKQWVVDKVEVKMEQEVKVTNMNYSWLEVEKIIGSIVMLQF